MNVTLTDDEIKQAIKYHLSHQGIDLTGKNIEIKIKSGRRGNGTTAAVTIEDRVARAVPVEDSDDTSDTSEDRPMFG